MRSKTQERIEELARERAVASIDLALVEDGIEIGKQMMAEMIATYNAPQPAATKPAAPATSGALRNPSGGSGYLNEVRSRLTYVSAYRFCRSDDIGLLVDAMNRCWAPYVPDEPPITPAAFKLSIRDLQVWCSSCMVAFSGSDPIGVLIGAKRPSGTLIHTIAVHPDHRRQGHGQHLLTSLSSKLSILGPPRMIAEVPDTLVPACELFSAVGYVQEALLTDYVLQRDETECAGERGGIGPVRDPCHGRRSRRQWSAWRS